MVNVVSAVSAAQNASLKPSVQSPAPATPAPPPSISDIDFVVSGIYVNNLQNVAILEYRSSETDQIIQQYPNQAQINAFKAAQRLAEQASVKQPSEPDPSSSVHLATVAAPNDSQETDTTDHVSAPSTGGAGDSSSDSGDSAAASSGGKTTSVVA